MAYDIGLEERIGDIIAGWDVDVASRKMFGGVGYFIHRNMAFGIKADQLIVKADAETVENLLQEPGVGYFDYGGKQMKSWLQVDGEVLDDDNLVRLLEISRDYTQTLPPKK